MENLLENQVETPELQEEDMDESPYVDDPIYGEFIESKEDKQSDEPNPLDIDTEDDENIPSEEDETKPDEKTDETIPAFSEELLSRAKQYGLSDEELGRYETEDQLQRGLTLFEHAMGKVAQKAELNPSEAKTETPIVQESNAPSGEYQDIKLELSEDDYDPEVVTVLTNITNHFNTHMRSMQEKVNRLSGELSNREVSEFHANFDRAVEKIGNEEVFGTGMLSDINDESQRSNRIRLYEQVETMIAGIQKLNGKLPPMNVLVERAYNGLFSDSIKKNTMKDLSKKLSSRSNQTIAIPTNRNSKPLTGIEKAIERSKKFDEERGL